MEVMLTFALGGYSGLFQMNEGEKEYQNDAEDYTKMQKLIIICIIRKYK